MSLIQILTSILNAFVGIINQLEALRASQNEILALQKEVKTQMSNLIKVTTELQADEAAIIAELNRLAQKIQDQTDAGGDPALIQALEDVHAGFVAALTPVVSPPLSAALKATAAPKTSYFPPKKA